MWQADEKILGIIGGMGPLATQLFYRQIIDMTDAHCDQEHLNMMILNHASMPDRTSAILKGDTADLEMRLIADAKHLEANGACAIAMPCNTSHYFAEKIQAAIGIPFVNMIKETVKVIADNPRQMKKVGILATTGTIKTGLYQKEFEKVGIQAIAPSEEGQAEVMRIIYDGIKEGGPIDYNRFLDIENELASKGCQAAILACTELSVFKEQFRLPPYYVDAMEVLSAAAITACGKPLKQKK